MIVNERERNGPKDGEPGEEVFISVTTVIPPVMLVAEVEEDGWIGDDVYEHIAKLEREYERSKLREAM